MEESRPPIRSLASSPQPHFHLSKSYLILKDPNPFRGHPSLWLLLHSLGTNMFTCSVG
jgi:hypothetical protein